VKGFDYRVGETHMCDERMCERHVVDDTCARAGPSLMKELVKHTCVMIEVVQHTCVRIEFVEDMS